jgi:hypothetical protein
MGRANVITPDQDCSACGLFQTCNDAQKRGFTTSDGPTKTMNSLSCIAKFMSFNTRTSSKDFVMDRSSTVATAIFLYSVKMENAVPLNWDRRGGLERVV